MPNCEHHPRRLCHQVLQEAAAALVRSTGESSPSPTIPGITAGHRDARFKPALRGCAGEKELATYHAALSYSAQIRTNSSRW